jgi:hypothetical protein
LFFYARGVRFKGEKSGCVMAFPFPMRVPEWNVRAKPAVGLQTARHGTLVQMQDAAISGMSISSK